MKYNVILVPWSLSLLFKSECCLVNLSIINHLIIMYILISGPKRDEAYHKIKSTVHACMYVFEYKSVPINQLYVVKCTAV